MRADILWLLFTDQHPELRVRAMERKSSVTLNAIRQELSKLARLDLISSRRDGNRLYYKANTSHSLHSILVELVVWTVGYITILKQSFTHLAIELVFIFGSMAVNEEGAENDIDL